MRTTGAIITDEIGAALLLRCGGNPERAYGAKIAQLAEDRFGGAGCGVVAAAKQVLDILGESTALDNLGMIEAAFSGATGAAIFDGLVNSLVVEPFRTGDPTTGWVREVEVDNFKSNIRIRREQVEQLKLLARGETAEHLQPEFSTSETYNADRFARQFVVDAQDLADDDIHALSEPARLFGGASLALKRDLVFTAMLANADLSDSVALFHATHSNLNTSAALSESNLDAGISAMLNTQENSRPVDAIAKFLVVPPALLGLAHRLNRNMSLPLSVRSDTRLENGVTDPVSGTEYAGSATSWYLSAAAGPIEFGFIDSNRPRVTSWPLTRGAWGLGYGINFDVGVGVTGFNGIQKNTA
jgi:hypothetical protein